MKNVDVVIPTRNRLDYLKRILDYYNSCGRGFNYIIVDSSNPVNKKRNKKLLKEYPNLKISYYDNFPEIMPQHHKFIKMVKFIKSKYCVFCADDDFIVPGAIEECADFLEKNPDYSAAHGSYIGFYIFNIFPGIKKFWWNHRLTPKSIQSSNPLERLSFHLKDYTLVLWAVRRTDTVKKCYRELDKANMGLYLLPVYGEILPDALTVIYGKIKSLKTFYGARQCFNSISSYWPSLIDAKNAKKFDFEYDKFKNCILNNLEIKNVHQKEKIIEIISSSIKGFMNFSSQEHIQNTIYRFLDYYPKVFSKSLRLLHASYLFSKTKNNSLGNIGNPSSKYFEDFNKIRSCVLEHE